MIIGAGPLQLPAYEEARRMGLRVVAVDRNPAAPGMRLADAAYVVDTRDTVGAIDAARRERIDGVLTLCTDFPLRTVAAVAHTLGLPGLSPEVALVATHKGLMREAMAAGGASIPRYARVRDEPGARSALEAVGLPAILKPTSSSGSRGVFKIERRERLSAAFAHAASIEGPGAEIVVEEFIDGPEVSVEVVSIGGHHHIIAITDKLTSGDPFWVETGHSQPSRLTADVKAAIHRCAAAGLDALGITDSPSHVEIKVGSRGPILIEIGARLGGDFISTELTLRSTGVSMPRAAIELSMGRAPQVERLHEAGAAIRYLVPSPGLVEEIRGVDLARSVPGVAIVSVELHVGDVVKPVTASGDRPGHVIAEGPDAGSAVEAAERALALIEVATRAM